MEDNETVYLKTLEGTIIKSGTETDLVNWANSEGLEEYEITETIEPGDVIEFLGEIQVVSFDKKTGLITVRF